MAGRPLRRALMNPKPQMGRRAAIREQVDDISSRAGRLPHNDELPQPLKVVIGPKWYSVPQLTPAGQRAFREMTGREYLYHETSRHLPALVWLAENRPAMWYEPPRVIPVPGGVYEIREYDGFESLHTPESIQWTRIEGAKSNPKIREGIRYTGDWHDFAKAYGVAIPQDEDTPAYRGKVRELQQKMVKNKSTIHPEVAEWVKKLGAEATKMGDFDTMALVRSMQLQLQTNGPRGVESVARNLTRLWL